MNTAEEALKRIEIHEAECKLMREMIEKRLDQGGHRSRMAAPLPVGD